MGLCVIRPAHPGHGEDVDALLAGRPMIGPKNISNVRPARSFNCFVKFSWTSFLSILLSKIHHFVGRSHEKSEFRKFGTPNIYAKKTFQMNRWVGG